MRLWIRAAAMAAVMVSLICSSASAETLRGDQLLIMLTDDSSSGMQANVNRYRAMGYIQGLLDSYTVFSTRDPTLNVFCMPEQGVSTAQARILIVKWLREHPKRLHEQARLLVFHALAEAFPCRNTSADKKSDQPEQVVVPRQN
jgi:hypothetical protein